MMMGPFLPPFLSAGNAHPAGSRDPVSGGEMPGEQNGGDLRQMVDELQQQVKDLQQRLGQPAE